VREDKGIRREGYVGDNYHPQLALWMLAAVGTAFGQNGSVALEKSYFICGKVQVLYKTVHYVNAHHFVTTE